ncbi:glycosyltransferase family 2 protein [Fulvivirgaceae bacterium BMA12]|uniref:Glycosyltransferase family 2 protein n=1 Tax=Agaribacillus aureus TaxID=3051825 RepID=A0ABT8L1N7_9BACT|nr:glycosyltransferase family 2 protein [Fulvivirgaceae bacterium BMA12]
MEYIEWAFWILLFVIFYAYLGYGIVLVLLLKIKNLFSKPGAADSEPFEPEVTLFVAAYNEAAYIEDKIKNTLDIDYPRDKLRIVFVTDGSDDGTPEILRKHEGIHVYHQASRAGKIGAINRGMGFVISPIVIFSDANAMLNKQVVREMVKHYRNPAVGCVAGEKRILKREFDTASGAGEGIYWRYESALKKMDSNLNSAIGAAGELFSIRTELFEPVEKDTLLDDFIISMRIAARGHKIVYEPGAYASESASASIKDEMKRKVRICAGGLQSIVRLKALLNPFRFGLLSFQYISHRVLRWTLVPLFLLLVIPLNYLLMLDKQGIYILLFYGQVLFYSAALIGWFLENRSLRIKLVFVPFYFSIMNIAAFKGFFRYIKGSQSVLWERANRASV